MTVKLRPATMDDAATLLAIRNDPEVRRQSRNTAPVTADEHHQWLSSKLRSRDTLLYLVTLDGAAVGQVRLDRRAEGEAEISISLRSECRGRGVGREAIAAGCLLAERELAARVVIAEIKPANAASIRAFSAIGFTERTRTPDKVVMARRCA